MPKFSRSLAVVIGIDQYRNGITTLQTATNDAREIARLLEQEHKYDRVWLLLDEKASLQGLQQILDQLLAEHVRENDRLLFYFAGHGIALNGEDGPEGFLIPQDARLGDTKTYLPMSKLQASLSDLPCRHFLGILDCCFAGAFRWSSTRKLVPVEMGVIHKERFDRFIQDPAWQAITSAAYDQTALDAFDLKSDRPATGKHSPFAAALIEALSGQADIYPPATPSRPAGDGVTTATELYLYLRDRIEPPTESAHHRQTPGIWPLKKHDKGEYIFLTPGHQLNLPPAPPLDASKNPYRGLQSFDAEQCDLFFGRAALTAELGKFVSQQPLTVVLGASGSGKSSLVKAGLIPDLQQQDTKVDYPQWQILTPIRPGESPFKALSNALAEITVLGISIPEAGSPSEVEMLTQYMAAWCPQHLGMKLLLAIDQFEELITLCPDAQERDRFLRGLALALTAHPKQLRLVVTLRSDFEPQFQNGLLKADWSAARFVVPAMTRSQLREAIEEPASKRVMYFQSDDPQNPLVEQLINEVAEMPGALPLLSFTLSELYLKYLNRQKFAQERGDSLDRAITEADYKELGGVARSLTQRADQEYEALVQRDPAYAETIRNVMLRMVSVGELARRRVPLSEFEYPPGQNERVKEVIHRFCEARLLVEGQDADGKTYAEPSHDALVRGWQKLLIWKQAEEESLILQRRLTPAAEEWKAIAGKDQSTGLLAKATPVIDGLDRRFYAIENLLSRLWQRSQPQNGRSRSGQFLWNTNPYLDVLNAQLQSNHNWFNQIEAEFVQRSVLQRRQKTSWQRRITAAVILGLSGLTFWALTNLRQAKISQMLTSAESAGGNLQSDRLILDALVDSLSAGQSLKNEWLLKLFPPKAQDQVQVIRTLRKAVYTVREYYKQDGFPGGVQSIFWKKKELLIVSTDNDGAVQIWNKKAQKLAELPGNQSNITQVLFSPNGNQLAIGTENGSILLWNWENQSEAATLQDPQCGGTAPSAAACDITNLSFNPDGLQLVSVGREGIARWWDLSTQTAQEFQLPKKKIINAGFQPDGELLLVATTADGKTISLVNARSQELTKLGPFSVEIDRTIISPNGEDIGIIYGQARSVSGSGSQLWRWRQKGSRPLLGRNEEIDFSKDGTQLAATGFNDGTIRLQNLDNQTVTELKGHQGQIANFNFRADGQVLATASADGTLRLWSLGEESLMQLKQLPDKLNSLSFSPDGQRIATQSVDGTVRLLDRSGKIVKSLSKQYPAFNSLSFGTGDRLATLTGEGTVGILDLADTYREFPGEYNPSSNLSFSPNGKQLAVTGSDNNGKAVYLLDIPSGKPMGKSFSYEETISTSNVIWKQNNQILLAGVQQISRAYKSIVLLDVKSGRQVQTISEKLGANEFSGISTSSDGGLAALVEADGTLSLWYMDGSKMGTVKDTDRPIKSAILSPDSSRLATVGEDGTTKLWEIGQLDELRAKGCDRIRDYLTQNPNVSGRDRLLCEGIGNTKIK
jgi:WD40 repeat protein